MAASSSRMTCLTSKEVKKRTIVSPLSDTHHKIATLHFFFVVLLYAQERGFWLKMYLLNTWYQMSDFDSLLDGILLSYGFCSHFGVFSFLFFFLTQILRDKHENYNTKFNPIFIQVSLMFLIYTIAIFMFGDWKYKWNWIFKKVLWSNFHTLNQ